MIRKQVLSGEPSKPDLVRLSIIANSLINNISDELCCEI